MRRTYLAFSILLFSAAALSAQEDAQFQTWMKAAAGANGRARAAITAKDNAAVNTEAKTMEESFDHIARFWSTRQKEDAVKFAETARDAAKALGSATTPEEQTAALQSVGGTCHGCHVVYRDGNKIRQ